MTINEETDVYILTEKGRRLGEKIRQANLNAIDDFFWDEFVKENPAIEEKLKKMRKKSRA